MATAASEAKHDRPIGRRRRAATRRRRRPARLWLLGLIVLPLLLLLLPLASGGASMVSGRASMAEGRTALLEGDLEGAEEDLSRAARRFRRAHSWLTMPQAALPLVLPVVRANTVALADMSRAGELLAKAGQVVAGSGLEMDVEAMLGPREGTLPVQAMRDLAPRASSASAQVDEAEALVLSVSTPELLGPVAAARRDLLTEIEGVATAARSADALTGALPDFLGTEGPRRYFFGAGSPSELRGSGGFVGAFAIVEAQDGRLSFSDFQPVQTLEDLGPDELPAADPSLHNRYDQYGGTGFWLNINMTPDFPSAGHAISQLYERVTGEDIDGVLVTTPAALARLMQLTGPVDIPGYGTLEPEDAVEVLGNEAYGDIQDSAERKRMLGAAAKDVLQRFLSGAADPVASARALAGVAAAGDLLLYSQHAEEQTAFEQAGIAGSLDAAEADGLLAVIGNNAAGNKVDYYMDRSIEHRVELQIDQTATAATEVALANGAPAGGLPEYIIGPFPGTGLEPGENLTILSAYCSVGCQLTELTRDGEALPRQAEVELGYPVFTNLVRLASGESTELNYGWQQDDAWQGDDSSGRYTFRFLDQPTIRPTRLRVEIRVPEGMGVVRASNGASVRGERVVWSGEPGARQDVTVEWRRPLGQSLAAPFRELFTERVATAR